MKMTASQSLLINLINIINRRYSTNYNIDDITNIEFTLLAIYIWLNNGSKYYIRCKILKEL